MTTRRHFIAGLSVSACLGILAACGTDAGPLQGDPPHVTPPHGPCGGPTSDGYMTCPDYKPPAPIPWGSGG